ncbi:PIN domain-containing protein [Methanocalculus sp.]|uniref:PIN domain-containing protein n=1 Tax=Methanocalculus sp. TaxID=2004547 RepID=UPI002716C933|nr:PIN domain-containing protein [Methanocalculus sp.]MDO8842070.1 hypothetical protein [Methanocalculus sp.]
MQKDSYGVPNTSVFLQIDHDPEIMGIEKNYPKVYLDVCCLCRPFDDQSSIRIRLEMTAVLEIIRLCTINELNLITSEAIIEEISNIPDNNKRIRVEKLLSTSREHIFIDEEIISRMHEIIAMGGDAMDSLHIACAEKGDALFISTDDDLITFIIGHKNIHINGYNPVTWLEEEGR